MLSLKNKNLSLTLAPEYGSNLISLKYKNQELIYTDEKLLKTHGFTGCFVLWPFPNRVRNKRYVFKGKTYSLENLTLPRWYHHAFARGLNWQSNQISPAAAQTWLNHDPTSPCWQNFPWASRLSLTYTLEADGLKIGYEVRNLDRTELGYGFGLHPLFKNAAAIKVPAKYVMESDKDLLPTGKLLPASLDKLTPVKDLNLDHVFTDLSGPQTVAFANDLNLTISASPDFTHAVVYTGEKEKYTAVEQQTCSTDAHNLDASGFTKEAHLIRIKPGGAFRGWIKYSVLK